MTLAVEPTSLPEVLLVKPRAFDDERGFFLETYRAEVYRQAGIEGVFVQDNHSRSVRGILRGLHYQLPHEQGKIVFVTRGEILDVAVDIRRGSPRFGQWTSMILSDENHHQLFMPPGFAHGFTVQSEVADVIYKCTDTYHADADRGILWSDPDLGIEWGIDSPIVSSKDAVQPRLSAVPDEDLPVYAGER